MPTPEGMARTAAARAATRQAFAERAAQDPDKVAKAVAVVRAAARQLVERTRQEQGLPLHVEDQSVLDAVAALVQTTQAQAS